MPNKMLTRFSIYSINAPNGTSFHVRSAVPPRGSQAARTGFKDRTTILMESKLIAIERVPVHGKLIDKLARCGL
jgi:hypothetical protein